MSTPTLSPGDGPTSTHFFCGGGGDTQGFHEAGFRPYLAINHDSASIETHSANFPETEHLIADINNIDMRRLPKTDVLWGSPICQESSPAGGRKRRRYNPAQLELLEHGPVEDTTWERTRATAYDILRATEIVGYDAVLCENVIEFATDWPLFDWWLQAMAVLGYNHTLVCASSAHIGDEDNPHAPQWRDRIYVAFTRKGIRKPDLDPRPLAWCVECGEDVLARQWWKNDRKPKIGKYRAQYLYRCPNVGCRYSVVEPYVRPAAQVIDWSDVGQRIGDRARPLAAATRRRIETGLETFGQPVVATVAGNTYERPGSGYVRAWPAFDAPLTARTCTATDALAVSPMLVPAGGTWNDAVSYVDNPMRTRMANPKGFEAVVTPEPFLAILRRNATAQSLRDPLATIAAGGNHHALVVPYYRTGKAKSAGDPLATLTVRDRFALVTGQTVAVDDCHMRMLQPRESFSGQRFPLDYELRGNKGQQTAQAGNAVSVNVARWVAAQTRKVLDGSRA
jgi:DNA (cytosine-5)-methyltransferase 1